MWRAYVAWQHIDNISSIRRFNSEDVVSRLNAKGVYEYMGSLMQIAKAQWDPHALLHATIPPVSAAVAKPASQISEDSESMPKLRPRRATMSTATKGSSTGKATVVQAKPAVQGKPAAQAKPAATTTLTMVLQHTRAVPCAGSKPALLGGESWFTSTRSSH